MVGAAAGAAGGGLFGKLKGLFGKEQTVPGPTDIADRTGDPAPTASTELVDKDAASTLAASTEVADRAANGAIPDGAVAASTELQDRSPASEAAPPPADTGPRAQPAPPNPFDEPKTPTPMPAPELPGAGEDSGIAAELKASLGALFDEGEDEEPSPGGPGQGDALFGGDPGSGDAQTPPPTALGDAQAMVPVDDESSRGAPSFAETQDAEGSDPGDPFAVQERPELDPFATADGLATDDEEGETADPFAASGTEHSHRVRKVDTQVQTKPAITPATIGLAGSPDTDAASKKKPAKLKIRYKRPQTFVKEFAENLERGGTYIKTPKPLENGRRCVFELTVPGFSEALTIRGAVTWSSRGEATLPEGQAPGMVIDYDIDDTEGIEGIRRAVKTLGG